VGVTSPAITTLEVMGGIWAGLKYIVTHPDAGDHFSEDLPTGRRLRGIPPPRVVW